jgi:putative addiction module component (TIGR02574 family)
MSSVSTVRDAALQLARQERAELAHQLIASLDEDVDAPDGDVETAWLAEGERRVVAAEQGSVKLEPWEVTEERITARLRAMRR